MDDKTASPGGDPASGLRLVSELERPLREPLESGFIVPATRAIAW
jgi:hypothetical protein